VTDDRSPLDPRVLAQLRAKQSPSSEARARVRARLAMAVPGMSEPRGGGGSSGGGGLSGAGGLGTHVIVIAAFVVGGGAGAAIYAALSKPPPPAVVYVDRPVLQAPAAATVAGVPVEATSAAPTGEDTAAAPRAPVAPSASTPSPASQLAAERALLDEARASLLQGAPDRALDRLARHARTFPHPLLAEERDAMRVEALARVGRTGEARAQADAFRRRWPSSLFLPTVDSAVAAIP